MNNEIYNADALTILPTIKTDSIDMILTDPPYNTTALKMDKQSFDLTSYLDEFKRVLKPNGWFFCFGTLDMYCEIKNNGWRKKFEYIWRKSNAPAQSKTAVRPYLQHEHIFACIKPELEHATDLYFDSKSLRTKGKPYKRITYPHHSEYNIANGRPQKVSQTINDGYREGNSVLEYTTKTHWKDKTSHPTQKPLALCQLLCKGYCKSSGIVLDPFMGSGTTPLAAKTSNRKYIGIEINPKYYKMAQNRVQGTL